MSDPLTEPTRRLWPDPDKGPWYVELYWMEEDGQLVPYGITILSGPRPGEPYNPLLNMTNKRDVVDPETGEVMARETVGYLLQRHRLTAGDLKGLKFGALVEQVLDSEAALNEWRAEHETERRAVLERLAEQWREAPKRPGRPRQWGPEELGQIARAYDKGGLPGVLDWYAVRTGDEVEPSTAWRWIKQAEQAGIPIRRKRKRSRR